MPARRSGEGPWAESTSTRRASSRAEAVADRQEHEGQQPVAELLEAEHLRTGRAPPAGQPPAGPEEEDEEDDRRQPRGKARAREARGGGESRRVAGVNRARARGQAAIEADPRSNVEDRGHGTQGQEGPRAPRERRGGAPGERDRRGRRPERDRSRRLGQGLAAAAARVEREGDEADRRGDGQRQPEGRGCEGEGRGGQGQGGRRVRGEDALGQRRARVPDALASIDEPEPQRVAGEEGGERGESEAEPGDRGRQHEPQDHGLGEKAPPAVLRGEGDRPPGDGRAPGRDGRAHGRGRGQWACAALSPWDAVVEASANSRSA